MCICYHFTMQEPFNFSDTIDGSALSYTITYKRSNSSTICGTTKVQATSCLNQICEYTSTISNFSDCLSSSHIMVTVFGTNNIPVHIHTWTPVMYTISITVTVLSTRLEYYIIAGLLTIVHSISTCGVMHCLLL